MCSDTGCCCGALDDAFYFTWMGVTAVVATILSALAFVLAAILGSVGAGTTSSAFGSGLIVATTCLQAPMTVNITVPSGFWPIEGPVVGSVLLNVEALPVHSTSQPCLWQPCSVWPTYAAPDGVVSCATQGRVLTGVAWVLPGTSASSVMWAALYLPAIVIAGIGVGLALLSVGAVLVGRYLRVRRFARTSAAGTAGPVGADAPAAVAAVADAADAT
jgi:hypothetical protein